MVTITKISATAAAYYFEPDQWDQASALFTALAGAGGEGVDITFTAPVDLKSQWCVSSAADRAAIEESFEREIRHSLQDAEVVPLGLFLHRTNRVGAPALHIHVVAGPLTPDQFVRIKEDTHG